MAPGPIEDTEGYNRLGETIVSIFFFLRLLGSPAS